MVDLKKHIVTEVKEYLEVAKVLDQILVEGGKAHEKLIELKRNNPSLTYLEVKDSLIELFTAHQQGTLIIKDIESLMNRLVVLYSLVQIADIELELDTESQFLFDTIGQTTKMFFTAKEGKLVPLQKDIIESFNARTAEKHLSEDSLKEMFESIKI